MRQDPLSWLNNAMFGTWRIDTSSRADLEAEAVRFQDTLDQLKAELPTLHGDDFLSAKDRIAWLEEHLPLVKHWLETVGT